MKYCSQCGKETKEGAKFCACCGAPIKNRDGVNGTDTVAPMEKRSQTRSIEASLSNLASPEGRRTILQKLWPQDVSIILKCWIWLLVIIWLLSIVSSFFKQLDTSSYGVISINHRQTLIILMIAAKWIASLFTFLEIVAVLVMLTQRKKSSLHNLYGLAIFRVILSHVPGYFLIIAEEAGGPYIILQTIMLLVVMAVALIGPVVTTILTKKMKFFEN